MKLDSLEKFNNKISIIWRGRSYKYIDIQNKIKNYKGILNLNNITKGSVVSIVGDFTPNCISMLFSLIEIKAIIVPFAKDLKELEYEERLRISKPQVHITFEPESDEFKIQNSNPSSNNNIYEQIRQSDAPGLVLFSSGSSGVPKAAVHNLANLLLKYDENKKPYKTLNFLLFDHWGGLNTMFHTFFNGGTIVSVEDRSPNGIAKLIEDNNVEILPATPTFLNMLILSRAYEKYNLQSLKIISYGAEPMGESTLKIIRKLFPTQRLIQTYGLIEVGVLSSKSNDDDIWMELGGIGYELRVIDNELQIKSKSTILGYLNAEAPITQDGWFKTGDLVETRGGKYKIIGRKSEIINIGGEKVHPVEVENFIKSLAYISDVTVYAEKSPIMGNILCANITLIEKKLDNLEIINDVKKKCTQKLERYKVPIKFKVVDNLEISSRFKKIRKIHE
jgi:acyl-CoA synthetase (AMP-forming)/AMP-acid ligase II